MKPDGPAPEDGMPWIIAFLGETWMEALSEAERAVLVRPLLVRAGGLPSDRPAIRRLGEMAARWALAVHTPAWLRLAGLPRFADVFAAHLLLAPTHARRQDALFRASLAGLEAAIAVERESLVLRALDGDGYELDRVGPGGDVWDVADAAADHAMRASAGVAVALAAGATWEAGVDSTPLDLVMSIAGASARLAAGAAAGRAVFDAALDHSVEGLRRHADAALAPTTEALKQAAVDLVTRMIVEVGRSRPV